MPLDQLLSTPLILHLETSTQVCSVAISNGPELLATREVAEGNQHTSLLTVLIEEALDKAKVHRKDLDAVSVSAGPGSYTGLRVGMATAKGLCYGLDIPMLTVSTLESLAIAAAQQNTEGALLMPMLDARRMEVYAALFDNGGRRLTGDSALILHDRLFDLLNAVGERVILVGNGTHKCAEMFSSQGVTILDLQCSAQHLIAPANRAFKDGDFADLAYSAPDYLKAPNITISRKKLI